MPPSSDKYRGHPIRLITAVILRQHSSDEATTRARSYINEGNGAPADNV